VTGVDCVLLSVEDSGWRDCTDSEMDVSVEEEVKGWLRGSWSDKGTRQIPACIAANLASIAVTKVNRRSVFLCRPSAHSFIVFTS